jgi:c-di-GMP-binding flagellar brake protein YcgR
MDDVNAMVSTIVSRQLPAELLFDAHGPAAAGKISYTRRAGEMNGLSIEVTSGEAPATASVVRVRVVVDRVLYEFAALVTRRLADPLPVFLARHPTEIHRVERRVHTRVEPTTPAARLRVALTVSGEWIPVELHNLSEGGVAFSSPDVGVFAVGHTVARLELAFDDQKPIETSAQVRNVYTIRYPKEVGPVYGVQWAKLTPDERRRLAAYVARQRGQPK